MQNEELRRTRAELERARNRWFELFEHAPIGYVTTRRDGTIADANAKACAVVGAERRRVRGRRLPSFVAPTDAARVELHSRRVFETGSESLEVDLLRPDGTTLSVRLESMTTGRNAASARTAIVDLTDVKKAQRALFEAQKMEALGSLARGVSHDFNNVLAALRGTIDMLEERFGPQPALLPIVERMKTCVEQGAAVTERLRTFSRRDLATSTVFDLNTSISAHAPLLRQALGEHVDLALELEAEDARVRASDAEIRQALTNLVVNAREAIEAAAREAHDAPDKITIRTENVHVEPGSRRARTISPGDYVLLAVRDTGPGVAAELQHRIFEPFFTTKPQGTSVGLGLAIVHSVAVRAGGRVQVRSTGRGASFELLLPRTDEAVSAAATDGAGVEPAAAATVLLAEDDPLVRSTTRYLLERAGYRVLDAASATEALECSARFPGGIDLLLTDLDLPGRDGNDLARTLRVLRKGIGIVVMSAHDTSAIVAPKRSIVLQKPFAADVLLRAVRDALAMANATAPPSLSSRPPPKPATSVARPRSVLLVDESDAARMLLTGYLERLGWDVSSAPNVASAIASFRDVRAAVLLTASTLPDGSGVQLARDLRALSPHLGVVFISGNGSGPPPEVSEVVLPKPIELSRLASVLERAARSAGRLSEGDGAPPAPRRALR